MNSLQFQIAGITIEIRTDARELHESLRRRYKDFPSESTPDLVVTLEILPSEIPAPAILDLIIQGTYIECPHPAYQAKIELSSGTASLKISANNPIPGVKYFLRACYAALAFSRGGLLLHTAGVVHGGRAFLFFGHSGSGKTTVARLSAQATVLNDDLVLLMPDQSGWIAHGTPFTNPTQVPPTNQHAPVAGLLRLVQSEQVALKTLSHAEASAELLSSIPILPQDPANIPALLSRIGQLLSTIPAYYLHFLPDDSFWPLVEQIGIKK